MLTGGVDSTLVAAALAADRRERGVPLPRALFVAFPDAESDEEPRERAVAASLRLENDVVRLDDLVRAEGMLAPGLELSRNGWFPSVNPSEAAVMQFVDTASREWGCGLVLTGDGGNELLQVSRQWTADLLRRGDVRGLVRFVEAQSRYFGLPARGYARMLLWHFGLRRELRELMHLAARVSAPRALERWGAYRAGLRLPPWLAPEPHLRRDLIDRLTARPEAATVGTHLDRARARLLDSPHSAVLLESRYLLSRRLGLAFRSPLIDPDVVELVWRLPPPMLLLGRRLKGLAYETLALELGAKLAASLGPVWVDRLFVRVLDHEGPAALAELGGTPRLSDLGVVDGSSVRVAVSGEVQRARMSYYPRWQVLAVEAWLQARFG
jgi:asparagine synthetase B (glutamine-hydrolysing)